MRSLTGAAGSCGTAVPPAWAVTRKPWDIGVTRGTWAALQHPPGVGKCQNALRDLTQKQVSLAALWFGSLECPQLLQKWDDGCQRVCLCLFPVVSAYGPPIWELSWPFLSPPKLSASTPPVPTNCRSSLPFGWRSVCFYPFYYCGLWWIPAPLSPYPLPLRFRKPWPPAFSSPHQKVPAFLVVFPCNLSAPFSYSPHAFPDHVNPRGSRGTRSRIRAAGSPRVPASSPAIAGAGTATSQCCWQDEPAGGGSGSISLNFFSARTDWFCASKAMLLHCPKAVSLPKFQPMAPEYVLVNDMAFHMEGC